jgi:hypothetical protein
MVYPLQPIAISAAVTLNKDSHAGTWLNLSHTTGFTVTLPASTGKGDVYKFFQLVGITSGNQIVAAAGTDIIQGGVAMSTDIGGTNILATATSDYITMSGSTTGGVKGSWFILEDVSAGCWQCSGFLVTTGTEATPFAAT